MNPNEIALLYVFDEIRAHQIKLSVSDYLSALRALQCGFGVGSIESLRQLCSMLWAKSDKDARLIDQIFSEVLIENKTLLSSKNNEAASEQIDIDLEKHQSNSVLSENELDPSPKWGLDVINSVETTRSIRRKLHDRLKDIPPRFGLAKEYFPANRRQMKQIWRRLRSNVRENQLNKVDIKETVERISRQGFMLTPVMQPDFFNVVELVMLFDWGGSMVPFHELSHQLFETAQEGGGFKSIETYYFHNYPNVYLYCDSSRIKSEKVSTFIARGSRRKVAMIISDAGAARGSLNVERLERTQQFINNLQTAVKHSVWLNPMPSGRWRDTTAGRLVRFMSDSVPMFEMSRRGLTNAVAVLCGHRI